MSKKINSIQFLSDKIIIDYGEAQIIQICKHCQSGQHFREFIRYFCPELAKHFEHTPTAIYFERRFYFMLRYSAIGRIIHEETTDFVEYLQWRFSEAELSRKQKQAEKKKLKQQRQAALTEDLSRAADGEAIDA